MLYSVWTLIDQMISKNSLLLYCIIRIQFIYLFILKSYFVTKVVKIMKNLFCVLHIRLKKGIKCNHNSYFINWISNVHLRRLSRI